jgi:hypothetical protein
MMKDLSLHRHPTMAGSRVTAALPPPSITPVTYVALVLVFHLLYLVLPLSAIAYPAYTLSTMLRGVASPSAPYILGAAGAYFSTWIIFSSHSKRGAPVDFLNTNPLNHFMLRCMNVSIIATEKMPASPSTNLIFACHPHGALAFNRAAVGFEMKHLWLKATGIKNLRVLAATAAFYVPLIREMWIWSYCIEASKKVAVRALSKLVRERSEHKEKCRPKRAEGARSSRSIALASSCEKLLGLALGR